MLHVHVHVHVYMRSRRTKVIFDHFSAGRIPKASSSRQAEGVTSTGLRKRAVGAVHARTFFSSRFAYGFICLASDFINRQQRRALERRRTTQPGAYATPL